MILELEHASFAYHKGTNVFHDVNLSIKKGQVLSILGTNGSGKSTLMKCILGLLPLQEGTIKYNEQVVKKLDYHKVSYVPQSHRIAFPLSVLDMVTLGRTPYISTFELPNEKDIAYAKKAIQTVGIEHLSQRNCNELSGGELQLVFIARALTIQPECIIMDEPETGLDLANQEKILDLIQKLSQLGVTIIFVTHDCNHALKVSDQTLLFCKNECIFGKSNEIICEKNLSKAFDIEMIALNSKVEDIEYQVLVPRKKD